MKNAQKRIMAVSFVILIPSGDGRLIWNEIGAEILDSLALFKGWLVECHISCFHTPLARPFCLFSLAHFPFDAFSLSLFSSFLLHVCSLSCST